MHHYGDNDWHGGDHLSGLHWIIPLIILLLLSGGIVWLIVRSSYRSGLPAPPSGAMHWPPPPARLHRFGDPALTALRLRYARGEVSRDDYLRMAADLGDVDALSHLPSPPPTSPPPDPPLVPPPVG